QDRTLPKIPSALMSFIRVILFAHDILAGLFEKDFEQVRAVWIVLNNKNTALFFDQRPRDRIDLGLIEPIHMRTRRILADDVRGINAKSVRFFDDLDHT